MTPHIADTNVYLMATRDEEYRSRFETFVRTRGTVQVSSVVAAELLIGVADVRKLVSVLHVLVSTADIVAPNREDWFTAGAALARLGGDAVTKGRSFWNDALLAAQCARLGAVLITENERDFRRLRAHIPVRTVKPFPAI
jgi:predicted nucleic acid-binding protein